MANMILNNVGVFNENIAMNNIFGELYRGKQGF